MKNSLSILFYITMVGSFFLNLYTPSKYSREDMFFLNIFWAGFVVVFLIFYWAFPFFAIKNKNRLKVIEDHFSRVENSPKFLIRLLPKYKKSPDIFLSDINVFEDWFSGFYFGLGSLGLGGILILQLSPIASLHSGRFGYFLQFPIGSALFSIFSIYFFIVGFSIFFCGVFGKVYLKK